MRSPDQPQRCGMALERRGNVVAKALIDLVVGTVTDDRSKRRGAAIATADHRGRFSGGRATPDQSAGRIELVLTS